MAKKGKTVQIWIDYRILGWAAVAVTAALLIFLIVTTITTNSRIKNVFVSINFRYSSKSW